MCMLQFPFLQFLKILKYCWLFTDYKTSNLARDDKIPNRRIYCVFKEHYSRKSRQVPATNGSMYYSSIFSLRYTHLLDNCGDDCPVWPGMYEFCAISAGCASFVKKSDYRSGSIGAAQKLNHGDSDIAVKYVILLSNYSINRV